MLSTWANDSRGVSNRRHTLRYLITLAFKSPWIVLAVWAGLLLFVVITELLPGDSAPIVAVSIVNDKFIHFSVYAGVAFVPAFGLRFNAALACLITTELVGIGLELAQRFVPQRSCDAYDVAANTAGVIAGAAFAIFCRLRAVRAGHTLPE